jgi:hypothetical protein
MRTIQVDVDDITVSVYDENLKNTLRMGFQKKNIITEPFLPDLLECPLHLQILLFSPK